MKQWPRSRQSPPISGDNANKSIPGEGGRRRGARVGASIPFESDARYESGENENKERPPKKIEISFLLLIARNYFSVNI